MEPKTSLNVTEMPGTPIQVGDITVTPLTQTIRLTLMFGGVVLHRPLAIRVERNGTVERRGIPDLTLWLQLASGSLLLLTVVLYSLQHITRKDKTS